MGGGGDVGEAMQAARLMHMRPGGHVNSLWGLKIEKGAWRRLKVVVKIRGWLSD